MRKRGGLLFLCSPLALSATGRKLLEEGFPVKLDGKYAGALFEIRKR